MGNPYAPTRLRVDAAEMGRRDLTTLTRRFQLLGLDDEGVADLVEHWDDFDDQWTPEFRRGLVRAPDSTLRDMIRARNDEFIDSTTTSEEHDVSALARAVAAAETEAADKISGTVSDVLGWVDGNSVRAMAASNLERGPEGGERKTLLAELDRIIDGA